jgi:hypothetical protein
MLYCLTHGGRRDTEAYRGNIAVDTVAKRAKLDECLAFLRDGDVLTVTKPPGAFPGYRPRSTDDRSSSADTAHTQGREGRV